MKLHYQPTAQSPLRLRSHPAAMDRAVNAAYGWPDTPTACGFLFNYEDEDETDEAADESPTSNTNSPRRRRKKPYRYRWPDEVRDEVLARLLA